MMNTGLYKDSKTYANFFRLFGFEKGMGKFIKNIDLPDIHVKNILDTGCGTGVLGLHLMKRFPGSKLLATDKEASFLKVVCKQADKMKLKHSRISLGISDINNPKIIKRKNGSQKKLEAQTFDIVTAGGVIGYSKDIEKTIKDLISLVRPGGYFIDIETNDKLMAKFVKAKYDYKIPSLKTLKSYINELGYKPKIIKPKLKEFPTGLTRLAIVVKKEYESSK